jgi:hypothetical protein
MLDSHDIDQADKSYFQSRGLEGLESIAQDTEKLLAANTLSNISTEKLRALLAYRYWQDGAEEDFVMEVWKTDPVWDDRDMILGILVEVFGYTK